MDYMDAYASGGIHGEDAWYPSDALEVNPAEFFSEILTPKQSSKLKRK
jgi:hypothetical protein